MQEERIIVNISTEGDVSIEVQGVKGKKCLGLTEELEKELGVVIDRKYKKEFREQPVQVTNQVHAQRGRK